MKVIRVRSSRREELIDVTALVAEVVHSAGLSEGVCLIQSLHTTCGVTVNENADPDVRADLLKAFAKALPDDPSFRHSEGNSAAHAKASLTGVSVTLAVSKGQLVLGTWQGIYLCEFDGPRERSLAVVLIPA
jgi:secondary thiamine-phosphate synthase enzyme